MWMSIYQVFFATFALSIPLATLLVAGRHFWLLIQSLRARRYKFLFIALLAILCVAVAFAVVGAVWFGYGVAHSKKDLRGDLLLILLTGLPFYGAAYGLWRLAGSLQEKLRHQG